MIQYPDDIIAEISRAIEKFTGPDPDRIVARAAYAALAPRIEKALADPPHAEYERLVEAVATLAEDEPIPRREIPLTFIMALMHFRRHEFGLPPPPSSADEANTEDRSRQEKTTTKEKAE